MEINYFSIGYNYYFKRNLSKITLFIEVLLIIKKFKDDACFKCHILIKDDAFRKRHLS